MRVKIISDKGTEQASHWHCFILQREFSSSS